MIAKDAAEAATLLERLRRHDADWAALPESAQLAAQLLETVADPEFPGALAPSIGKDGTVQVYAVALTVSDWRRLSPLLSAFAGPTVSSFEGKPEALDPNDPVAKIMLEAEPAVTAVLRLPAESKLRSSGFRALIRARETLGRSPDLQRRPSEPTSWLVAEFQDRLNVGARDAAFILLRRLGRELRLDALNLRFLEVQALAQFGEWREIVELPDFPSLCLARRPPSVSALLLEALYQSWIENPFANANEQATRDAYEENVRPLAQSLLTLPAPPNMTDGGWRIAALEAWVSGNRDDLRQALEPHLSASGWLEAKLAPVEPSSPVAAATEPIEQAREALSVADSSGNLDAVSRALALLETLEPEQLEQLKTAEPFRSMLQTLDEVGTAGGPPANWVDWLKATEDPAFTNAFLFAQRGSAEWPTDGLLDDPVQVSSMCAALEQAQSVPLAADRGNQALPFMVAWLQKDAAFPSAVAAPIYSSLLTLLALGATRGRPVYESSQILVDALLGTGLDARKYRDLVDDIGELAGTGPGLDMVYWLLEIVEDLYRHACPDQDARERFLHSSLAKLVPIFGRLSSLQRAAIRKLADELGWQSAALDKSPSAESSDDLAARLKDKRIAIYTLTESSSRRAKEALEALAPNVTVDCSADHVGTARLRAMAEGADLFVLTSLSAKHAATDYIREHRGTLPLAYAQGRGFSSILRAIEEHLRSAT